MCGVHRKISINLTYQFRINIDKKHPALIVIQWFLVLASSVGQLAVYWWAVWTIFVFKANACRFFKTAKWTIDFKIGMLIGYNVCRCQQWDCSNKNIRICHVFVLEVCLQYISCIFWRRLEVTNRKLNKKIYFHQH